MHPPAQYSIKTWNGPPSWSGEAIRGYRKFSFADLPWSALRREGLERDGAICVKASNSRRVLRFALPSAGDAPPAIAYAKRYLANNWRRRLGARLTGSKASREFRLGHQLLLAGVPTPLPLAWAEHALPFHHEYAGRKIRLPPASYLLTLEWPNAGSIRSWLKDHPASAPAVIGGLAAFLAQSHRAGFYHDDCSAEHILVGPEISDSWQADPHAAAPFAFIDLDNGRLGAGPVSARLRISNLFQILRSLPVTVLAVPDRVALVESYVAAWGGPDAPEAGPCIAAIERLAARKVGRPVVRC